MIQIIDNGDTFRVFGNEPNSEIPELIGLTVTRHHDHFELDREYLPEVISRMEKPYFFTDTKGKVITHTRRGYYEIFG